jgi:RNA polymerase-binding transcription factor
MVHMDARNVDGYKRLLLAKRDELLPATLRTSLTAGRAEGHEGDPTDRATEEAQTTLRVHLSQSDIHLLQAVEEALVRIEHGAFGVCQACQRPIAEARLKVVPWTHLCRDCKEQQNP